MRGLRRGGRQWWLCRLVRVSCWHCCWRTRWRLIGWMPDEAALIHETVQMIRSGLILTLRVRFAEVISSWLLVFYLYLILIESATMVPLECFSALSVHSSSHGCFLLLLVCCSSLFVDFVSDGMQGKWHKRGTDVTKDLHIFEPL